MAVRKAAGLFDVSHMGEFEVEGPGALAFLQRVTSNDVAKLVDGQAQYSALPMPNGAPVDDVIVYRRVGRPLPARRQRRQHREGLRLARRRQGPEGCDAQRPERRLRPARAPGPRGAGDPPERSRPLDLPAIALLPLRRGRGGRPSRRPSRAPATPARTASRSSSPPSDAEALWRALLEAGRDAGPRARGPRRARHAAPRGQDVPLRQRHRRDHDAWSRRASAGSSRSTRRRATSSAARVLEAQKKNGAAAQAGGLRDGRPRHRAPRLPGLPRRASTVGAVVTSGTLRPVPPEEHRPLLPARGPVGRGHRVRGRHPRPPSARPGSSPRRSTSGRDRADKERPWYPDRPPLHEGPRVGPRRGGPRHRRHHRLRPEAARRRGVPRAARGRARARRPARRFGTVESVKAVSELFAPVSRRGGRGRTPRSSQAPEAVNTDPYGEGWMIVVKLADPGQARGADGRRGVPGLRRERGEVEPRLRSRRARPTSKRPRSRPATRSLAPPHRPDATPRSRRCSATPRRWPRSTR